MGSVSTGGEILGDGYGWRPGFLGNKSKKGRPTLAGVVHDECCCEGARESSQ